MGLAKGSSSRWVGGCIGGDSQSFSPQTPGGAGSPGPAWLQGSSRDGLEKQGPPSLLTCNYVHLNLLACQGCTWNPTCLKESWPGGVPTRCPVLQPVRGFVESCRAQRSQAVVWRGGARVCFVFQLKYGDLLTS